MHLFHLHVFMFSWKQTTTATAFWGHWFLDACQNSVVQYGRTNGCVFSLLHELLFRFLEASCTIFGLQRLWAKDVFDRFLTCPSAVPIYHSLPPSPC